MRSLSNLALSLPHLIGREDDLRVAASLLARTRLLTLTGPGGCGKTTLALHMASTVRSMYPDGVWVIELAPFSDPTGVPEAVCGVLRAGNVLAEESNALSPLEQVINALRDREALLVLDNCEHLVAACADFVEAMLRQSVCVRMLATSREALKCQGEAEWLVPSLTLPPLEVSRADDISVLADLRSNSAIQLFVERAQAVLSSFDLTAENALQVLRICRGLDGLPLAIELAARSVKVLSLSQIEDAVADDVRFLHGARRTAPDRQRTLHATVEWSYRLHARGIQELFCRLSILAGDFSVQLAEAISSMPSERVLAGLSTLVDASLLQVVRGEDEARYRMLETIKQYGRHQLACEGEDIATFERYCEWAACYVASSGGTAEGEKSGRWLDALEREYDHVRATLQWMLAQREIEQALQLATRLLPFWRQRGHVSEGRRWLEALLALCDHCGGASDSHIVAAAYNGAGVLALWQCEHDHARLCHETALAILQRGNDNQSATAMTRFRLGFLAEKCKDYDSAKEYLEQSLLLYRATGDPAGEQMVRSRLGLIYHRRGDHARAEAYLAESLAFQCARGATGAAASILLNLGIMALERGQIRHANSWLEESLQLNQQVGDRFATLYSCTHLGFVKLRQNKLARAEQYFRQALGLARADGNPEILARLLDGLAMVAVRHSASLYAAHLWGSMAGLQRSAGLVDGPVDRRRRARAIAAARIHAEASAFDAAWNEGSALSLEAAIARASARMYSPATGMRAADPEPDETKLRQTSGLRIKALGTIRIWQGDRELVAADFVYAKARELLLYLVGSPARTKEQICLALWPDADQAHASMSFRVVLYHARRALGRQDWIVHSQRLYSFNHLRDDDFTYDVDAFEANVAEAKRICAQQPEMAMTLLEEALVLYDGEYAESLGLREWAAPRQRALRQQYEDALLVMASLQLTQGEVRAALSTYQRLTEQNNLLEEAHRGVIRCFVELRDFSRAAEYYQHLCELFEVELGIAPAPETRAALIPAAAS